MHRVVVERSGEALASTHGGEDVTVTGLGFTDVVRAEFRGSNGETALGIDVTPISDTEVLLTTPNVSNFMKKNGDGVMQFQSNLVLVSLTDGVEEDSNEQPVLFEGPSIKLLSDEHTQKAFGAAHGGQVIAVIGRNFTDVTDAYFDSPDGEPIQLGFSVETDTRIELDASDMSKYLTETADGTYVFDTKLTVVIEDESVDATSNKVSFRFEGPVVIEAVGEESSESSGSALPLTPMLLIGRNFEGVVDAEITAPGMVDPQPVFSVSVTTDKVLSLVAPDMTDYLTLREDGTWAVEAEIRLLYEPDLSAPITVKSNAAKFTFEGPIIDSVVVEDTTTSSGTARGGERLVVTGRNLGRNHIHVDKATFYDGSSNKNANDVIYESSTQLIIESPNMISSLPESVEGANPFIDTVLKVRYTLSDESFVESNPLVFRFIGYGLGQDEADETAAADTDTADASAPGSSGGGVAPAVVVAGLVVAGAAAAGGGGALRRRVKPGV